ncbi:hypothetical protein AVEN_249493-1 [Araneus ventricosus]|uniref:CCHC-type domain-containing protein n=1 Tax=Araneus ventricosus TaxID=182803 RepID=A0A4Y2NL21_ARAVE|nr:hypothetical protein AVEN_249493-1 [Araneus ventricosus]
MSSLTKYRKSELIALAADLNVELLPNDTVVNILKKIKESPDYDADFALDTIKCIREEKEIEEKRLERQEAEAAQIREYELEKLRLTQSNDTASVRSNASNGSQNYRIPSIKSVLSPFDPEKSDVSLFLTVFKRQADKLGIPDEELVTQLISVLPANMTELIIRDTGNDTDDFEVVKKILLERFRLSTDAYRVKYMTHQKGVNSLWKDLVFELNSYFNGWLEGAEVDTFEKLKDLMIADQIKRRASSEIKTHFVDKWGQMNDPYVVASNFDQYELARKTLRKPQQNKPFDKPSFKRTNSFRKNGKEGEKNQEGAKSSNWRQRTKSDETRRSEQFERRKKPACYSCGSLSHLRPSCPELRKPEHINKLSAKGEFHEVFKPYLKVGKIFGLEMEVLRDTGSSVDLISFKNVKESDLTGDYVWARQALTNEHTCLALAEIDLEIDGGFNTEKSNEERRETIEDKIKDKVLKLELPKSLAKQMIDIVRPICFEIRKWKKFHQDFFYDPHKEISLPDSAKLCWTTAGTIDYRKTAEELVCCDELNVLYPYAHYLVSIAWKITFPFFGKNSLKTIKSYYTKKIPLLRLCTFVGFTFLKANRLSWITC